MRFLHRTGLLVAALALLTGCGGDEPAAPKAEPKPAEPAGALTLKFYADPAKIDEGATHKISCEAEADFCAAVLDQPELQEVPRDTACTMQYGGPQVAGISGTVEGMPVALEFSRANGCEIARWEALEKALGELEKPLELPQAEGGTV